VSEWFDRIAARLDAHQHKHVTLAAGDGRLLVTEHGARVLACEMPGVAGNLFFHPPFMEQADAADEPTVAGGDRLWIAPEVGWFWPSLDDARRDPKGAATTPMAIDPGYFGITDQSENRVAMDARIDLTDVRDDKALALYATREVRVIEAPPITLDGLLSLSFALTHSLSWADASSDQGAVAGVWSILQVPPAPEGRGTLICPTTRRVEPRSYYEPFGDKHVAVDDDRVRFLIDGKHRIKMGVTADATTGRMGYYANHGDVSSLIVRIFAPQPGEPYCDLPRDEDAEQRTGGDALQAYNDDGDAFENTTFGEMEYHDPCLIAGKAPHTRTGASVTHALVGPDDAIKQAGQQLLGVAIEAI
jgi:hypothetical protein